MECLIRRTGSPPHALASCSQIGLVPLWISSSQAESACEVRTVDEVGPGKPPKSSAYEELSPERVCQAKAGPSSVLLTSCHGVESDENEIDRSRYNRSLLVGADV